MKNKNIHEHSPAIVILILLAVSAVGNAAEYDASVRASIGASDNIARTAQNEVDETLTTFGLDFNVTEQTNRMDLDLRTQFDYVDYADDTFDSEWVGGVNALVNFTLIDERLRWVVQDNFGQTLFNPLQPARPNNREDVNFLTTGPTFNLLPGSRNLIDIDLRYSRMDFEERPFDNDRLSAALSVGREISRESTMSLNLTGERTEFDNDGLAAPTAPIEQYEAFVRYETTGNRSALGFDVGPVVQDNFGQTLFNPLQPARPNNREDVNFLTTGPTFNLLPGSRNLIDIDLRYSRMDFEERPFDNDRLSAALSVGREISRESTMSLNLTGERTEFDNDGLAAPTAPIEQYEAFVRYETTGNRSALGFDVGYIEVEFAGSKSDGILARVDYSRQTSANGNFTVSVGSQFSDQGNIFRFFSDITNNLGDTTDIAASPAPFQNNFFALTYTLDQTRYAIDASFDWNQEDFEDGQGFDRDVFRGDLVLRREVTRTIFAGARIGFLRREFDILPRRDDDLILGLNIGYRFTAGFDLALEYQHFQRNSIFPGADFTENRAFLRVSYTPVWSR